jgi:hypothetical protein
MPRTIDALRRSYGPYRSRCSMTIILSGAILIVASLSPQGAQVTEHLSKRHSLPLQRRYNITNTLRIIHKTGVLILADSKTACARPDYTPADADLQTITGFHCKGCGVRTRNKETGVRHIRREHADSPIFIRGRIQAMLIPVRT